jgi:hypothetical protein
MTRQRNPSSASKPVVVLVPFGNTECRPRASDPGPSFATPLPGDVCGTLHREEVAVDGTAATVAASFSAPRVLAPPAHCEHTAPPPALTAAVSVAMPPSVHSRGGGAPRYVAWTMPTQDPGEGNVWGTPAWMPSCRRRPAAFFVPAAIAAPALRRLVSYIVAIWVAFHDGQHRVVARRGFAVSGPRKDGSGAGRGGGSTGRDLFRSDLKVPPRDSAALSWATRSTSGRGGGGRVARVALVAGVVASLDPRNSEGSRPV